MAEKAENYVERTIPELHELIEHEIFNEVCI